MNKIYASYFKKWNKRVSKNSDSLHILNEEEQNEIKKIYKNAIIKSALLGAFGVIFYFLPLHLFPNFFLKQTIKVFDFSFELPYMEILWGIFLMILELHLLVIVNLKAVHNLANATGFFNENEENQDKFLLQLGLDAKELGLNDYGIDPYQEVNKNLLLFFNFILKLKGFLANKLLQYLVKRLMGRYAIRYVIDYVGIPIYMLINAYSSHLIFKKAKVCILGSNLINDYIKSLKILVLNNEEKILLYDTLQLIAMSKRDYHKNHFILTQALFDKFDIEKKARHHFTFDYYERLQNSTSEIQQFCKEIVTLGFILDGKVSYIEQKKIKKINEFGLLNFSIEDLNKMTFKFVNGKPINL